MVAAAHPGGAIEVLSRQGQDWLSLPLAPAATVQPERNLPAAPACCATDPPVPITAPPQTAAANQLPVPAAAEAFKTYLHAATNGPALGTKHSKLIALALSILSKCEPCVGRGKTSGERLGKLRIRAEIT